MIRERKVIHQICKENNLKITRSRELKHKNCIEFLFLYEDVTRVFEIYVETGYMVLYVEKEIYEKFTKTYGDIMEEITTNINMRMICVDAIKQIYYVFEKEKSIEGEKLKELLPRLRFGQNGFFFYDGTENERIEIKNGVDFSCLDMRLETVSEAKHFMKSLEETSENSKTIKGELQSYIDSLFDRYEIIEELKGFELLDFTFYDEKEKKVTSSFQLCLPLEVSSIQLLEENGYRKEYIHKKIKALSNRIRFFKMAKKYDPSSFLYKIGSNGGFVLFNKTYAFVHIKDEEISDEEMERKIRVEKLKQVVNTSGFNWTLPYEFRYKNAKDEKEMNTLFLKWVEKHFPDELAIVKDRHANEFITFATKSKQKKGK